MSVGPHVDDYLQHLRLERGLSGNSIAAYRRDIQEFAQLMHVTDWNSISQTDVSRYLNTIGQGRLKPTSIARKISSLKRFFEYLLISGTVKSNPMAGVSAPKIARYHPSYLSVEEITRIIQVIGESKADKQNRLGSLRDRAAIELLYGSGLRISELIALKLSDFEFEAGFIRVVGKGNKQRLAPLGEFAAGAVQDYVDQRDRRKQAGSSLLFPNRRGKPLSRVALWKMIKKRVVAAGITKPVSPHTFRHSFATHMLEGGADLRVVQEMLGHADISTTQVYLTIDRDYIIAEHRKYHPRELARAENQ